MPEIKQRILSRGEKYNLAHPNPTYQAYRTKYRLQAKSIAYKKAEQAAKAKTALPAK